MSDFVHNLILVLVLATAVGCVSFTVAKTKVAAPFRDWVDARSDWFGNLFSCPYCIGHWLAFGAVAIYRPTLVHLWYPLDLLVTAFVVIAFACFVSGLLFKSLYHPE